jgi:hypothetical protein
MLLFPPYYGFIPVAATPVRESWHGGNSGEAKVATYERRSS